MNIEPIGTVREVSEEVCLIDISPPYCEGLEGVLPGDSLDVLYWMHHLGSRHRQMLKVHPQGDRSRPIQGVFGLRSPMRPNPIGVSTVQVHRVKQGKLFVNSFDAKDGSPVIDLKARPRAPERKTLVRAWGKMHDTIVRALREALGEGWLRDILYRPTWEFGRGAAEERKPDAAAIGRDIMRFEENWDLEGRIIEDTPGRFVREVTHCPWSYFSPLSCRIFAWWMEGLCQGMNERFLYRLEKTIPEGAPSCVWSVEGRHE